MGVRAVMRALRSTSAYAAISFSLMSGRISEAGV